jgi:hypothetical protein
VIKRWNLRTPGREKDTDADVVSVGAVATDSRAHLAQEPVN